MNQAKSEGKYIIALYPMVGFFPPYQPQIVQTGQKNGQGDHELHPVSGQAENIQRGQSEGKGMSDGKSRDQNRYLPPLSQRKHRAQSEDEQHMIEALRIKDVFPAEGKINGGALPNFHKSEELDR